jgi:hypothetical protein
VASSAPNFNWNTFSIINILSILFSIHLILFVSFYLHIIYMWYRVLRCEPDSPPLPHKTRSTCSPSHDNLLIPLCIITRMYF